MSLISRTDSADGAVAEIVLNRPDRRNALNYQMATQLVGMLRDAASSPEVNAVLLRGTGRSFCAGGDLAEFQASLDGDALTYHDGGTGWVELMRTIPALDVPVIVAAHGHALAGGCGLVAAADVALVAETTSLGLSEIRIGLFPAIVYSTLAAAVTPRRAHELALSGRRISAQEAVDIGLAHRLLPDGGFEAAARAVALEIASFGSTPLRLGKELMRAVDRVDADTGAEIGKGIRGAFMTSPDFRRGLASFLDRQ